MKKAKLSKNKRRYRLFYKAETIFRDWLNINIMRFNHKPYPNTKGGFYFQGITKAISLELDFRQPEAMLSFDNLSANENYDYYSIQYIGQLKHHPLKGFYDADRVDKVYTYYATYSELIINEVFEPIVEYCNENFTKENSLYLINYGGATEGFISSNNKLSLNKLKNTNLQFFKYKLLI